MTLTSLETVLLPFIEEIRFGTAQVNNLRTTVAVLLLNCALLAIIGVGNARSSAYYAPSLVRSVIAFVADSDQRAGSYVGVANYTFSVALLAQTSYGDARLLAAENKVGMMLGHCVNAIPYK